jgi:predicted RecA/RadA family phage recombinase
VAVQGFGDVLALAFFSAPRGQRVRYGDGLGVEHLHGKAFRADLGAAAHGQGVLDGVFQLADVARPVV